MDVSGPSTKRSWTTEVWMLFLDSTFTALFSRISCPRGHCWTISVYDLDIASPGESSLGQLLQACGSLVLMGALVICPLGLGRQLRRLPDILASNGCSDAHASGVCLFAGLHISPRTWSVRVGFLMTFVVGMVLLAAYSARLIASITIKQHSLPFTSLEGLLKKETHRLGVHKDSAEYNVLKSAKNGTLQSIFTTRMTREPQDYPIDVLSGLERICADRKYAFVTAAKLAKYYFIQVNCTIDQVPDPFMTGDGFLIFSKQNPYVRIINHYLRMMQNSGLMSKLYAKSFHALKREDSLSNTSVDVQSAAPIFTLLFIGMITGVIVLGIELGMKSLIQKQSQYHREQLAFRQ
uniref:Ionotropic glutamate receptor C-terminal domain-containing protein n=1 Tax=Timema cristinae TaxID=61476 RepID=A0A7R9DGG0_TIMCR|nr:unnamed protein product [Timema cristinae]